MISKIEKAILDANVGLTPSNNGEIIRCVVPALTEERRRELIKKAKAQGETTKVTVRNARRDGIDLLKKAQKNEGLSEDGEKEGEEELQKVTDKYVKAVDAVIAEKEKEILTVSAWILKLFIIPLSERTFRQMRFYDYGFYKRYYQER